MSERRRTIPRSTADGRRRLAAGLACFCLAAILFTGCGSDAGTPSGGATAPTTRTASSLPADLVRTDERGPAKLTVRVDRNELTIPETLSLEIEIQAEQGVHVGFPEAEEWLGDFAVKETSDAEPVHDDLTTTYRRTYTLEAFMPGETVIPPVETAFADAREKMDGSNTTYQDKLHTSAIPILVHDGLADVKGPQSIAIPLKYRVVLWIIGVVVAVVVIALLARWLRGRQKERAAIMPMARKLAPHLWALSELDKLAAEDLLGRGLVQEFYYRINGIARRYIELRFDLKAGEQTSEEFVRALQYSAMLQPRHKELLQAFVNACDPVKYARYEPQRDEIEWVQSTARNFVIETSQPAGGAGETAVATAAEQQGGDA